MKLVNYFLLLSLTTFSVAQRYESNQNSIIAFKVKDLPVIDGVVLDDPAWEDVVPATGFVQQSPDEGKPATERTEVKIMFSSNCLLYTSPSPRDLSTSRMPSSA